MNKHNKHNKHNKYKKPQRQIKYTILIYCEGKTDYVFMHHLKALYAPRYSTNKQITLKKGKGGGLKNFISDIVTLSHTHDYNEQYILLDSDNQTKEERKKAEAEAKAKSESQEKNIHLIWQEPCLEGVFLRILKGPSSIKHKNSASCKSAFNQEYLKSDSATLKKSQVTKLFPKEVLEEKRKDLPEVERLIQLMENKKTDET